MTQPTYPIVGAETGCYPRIELRDFIQKPLHFSLFVRAMIKIQDMNSVQDREKANSWWQIGSIHGLPYDPWSGDPNGPQKEVQNTQWGGYCYHGAPLFPPWHRILLLLVEQALVREAIAIATEFEAKDSAAKAEGWLQAAKEVRYPFWDWTRPETAKEGIPKICQDTVVTIVNPGGSRSQVRNPLNHYVFATSPGAAQGVEYMGKWTRTYRWANSNDNPTKEDYDQAVKAFSQKGQTLKLGTWDPIELHPADWLKEKVHDLFKYDLVLKDPGYAGNMWAYFSNTGSQQNGVSPPMTLMPSSIEDSHNTVHVDVGGNGSMSANEYAAYDPIFFLHHSNVDRIYAFWEYLYPEYTIGNGWKDSKTGQIKPHVTDNGTFYQSSGSEVNHLTPFHPFRDNSSDYWNTDKTAGLLSNGPINKFYTYPPIVDPKTGQKVQVDVPYDKNNLVLRQQYQQILLGEWGRDLGQIATAHQTLPFELPLMELLFKVENGIAQLRQFILVGLIPEFAFSGSYRLEIYLLPSVVKLATGFAKAAAGLLQQVTGFGGFGIVQQGVEAVEDVVTLVVNNMTVLGRSDPNRCAACRERRAAGSHIRGVMQLDPRVILYLFASLDPTQLPAVAGLAGINALIQGSFGMRLVKPDGTRLAAAQPDFSNDSAVDQSTLPKMELFSQLINFNVSDVNAPVAFGAAESHGVFGASHGWKLA